MGLETRESFTRMVIGASSTRTHDFEEKPITRTNRGFFRLEIANP